MGKTWLWGEWRTELTNALPQGQFNCYCVKWFCCVVLPRLEDIGGFGVQGSTGSSVVFRPSRSGVGDFSVAATSNIVAGVKVNEGHNSWLEVVVASIEVVEALLKEAERKGRVGGMLTYLVVEGVSVCVVSRRKVVAIQS